MKKLFVLKRGQEVGVISREGDQLQFHLPIGGIGGHKKFQIQQGQSLHKAIEDKFGRFSGSTKISEKYQLVDRELGIGEYFPRLQRGAQFFLENAKPYGEQINSAYDEEERAFVADSRRHLILLLRRLEEATRFIEPVDNQLGVYGLQLRELLISACTEVEAQFKWIMDPHLVSSKKPTKINQYFCIEKELRLSEYTVNFHAFPRLSPIKPFAAWSSAGSCTTLRWYQDYNKTKHNRADYLDVGTLGNVLSAIGGVAILIAQQVGAKNLAGDGASQWPDPQILHAISANSPIEFTWHDRLVPDPDNEITHWVKKSKGFKF